jgi:hypothetical protein
MEVSGDLQALVALPQITTPVPTVYEARWAPQPVWRVLKKKKSLAFPGIRTPDGRVHS